MLALYTSSGKQSQTKTDLSVATLPPDIVWIDMLDPDAMELNFVERCTGLHVPRRDELSEIESSSRLKIDGETLYLGTPIVFEGESHAAIATPVGFVLARDCLITIRFQELTAFRTFVQQSQPADRHYDSTRIFVGLMEAIVDRMADKLENVGSALDTVSHRIFHTEITNAGGKRRRPVREDADLRELLQRVGGSGDLTSKLRDSLLGVGRIVPYVLGLGTKWLPAEVTPRLQTLERDIASLSDYDVHLTNKVQLLLDATLGLINIQQNNIIKVLTIVSVVGVPPTLVASMYGMNFRYMPELNWTWGYPFGLAIMVLSALVPLLWFKLRGWL
jgi:magnesium transporter